MAYLVQTILDEVPLHGSDVETFETSAAHPRFWGLVIAIARELGGRAPSLQVFQLAVSVATLMVAVLTYMKPADVVVIREQPRQLAPSETMPAPDPTPSTEPKPLGTEGVCSSAKAERREPRPR